MAELVGGAFLSSFFQFLFDQVASPLLSKIFTSPTHDEGEKLLKELESKFGRLSVVLNDAEKKQITNPVVKEWMDELKDVFDQAKDLLDKIATKELGCKVEAEYQSAIHQVRASNSTYPFKKQKASTSTSDSSSFNAELVSRMKEIVGSLEKLLKEKDDLGLKEDVGLTHKWSHSRRLPSTSLVDESGVYGRDKNKEEIINILLSGEATGNKIDVIPIVGMGGVGKTTLAQLVYNDGRVVEHFDMKAWICVSDEFDVLRVTRTILGAITRSNYDKKDLNLLQVELKKSLLGKKFLIVLDDIWNEDRTHWENLWTPFTAGASGSKIIATTRFNSVASIMRTVPTYYLQQLSDEDCWSLFAKIAFDKGDSKAFPKLEEKGKQIVKKYKGLPLAVKTLGGLLRLKLDVEVWDEILKSDIWDLPEDKNNILPVLRLSYDYLPLHLKQCFAYCSLFPKVYKFKKEKLVMLWIAENIVQQPRKNKTLQKIGEEYFHELLSRSFFQKSSGNESFFVMHDLVHDLAQVAYRQFSCRVDGDENCTAPVFLNYIPSYRDTWPSHRLGDLLLNSPEREQTEGSNREQEEETDRDQAQASAAPRQTDSRVEAASTSAPANWASETPTSSKGYSLSPSPQRPMASKKRVLVDLDAIARGEDPEPVSTDSALPDQTARRTSSDHQANVQGKAESIREESEELRARKRRKETGKALMEEEEDEEEEEEEVDPMAKEWKPPLMHHGRPINTTDQMCVSSDLAHDLTKALLLPLDIATHNELNTQRMLKGSGQMMAMCIQRMHIGVERVEAMENKLAESTEMIQKMNETVARARTRLKAAETKCVAAEAQIAEAEVRAAAAEKLEREARETLEKKTAELESLSADWEIKDNELWQKGWDEAGVKYAQKLIELRDKLFSNGWKAALKAAGVADNSDLYSNIPVPSTCKKKTAAMKTGASAKHSIEKTPPPQGSKALASAATPDFAA